MKVVPTGVFFTGECEEQTDVCTARTPAPITAVKTAVGRSQINICRACLEKLIRDGQWEIEGARVPYYADIAVLDAQSHPVLIVECKMTTSKNGLDYRARATQTRRNLLTHAAVPNAPFLIVVYYPNMAYLWSRSSSEDVDGQPDFTLDLTDELQRIPNADTGNDYQNAEQHVVRWLRSVLDAGPASQFSDSSGPDNWLIKSGLLDAIHGGSLVAHLAV